MEKEYRNQEIKLITSWEKELNLTISPEIWKNMSDNTWKTTSSLRWRKIQLRFFKTPVIQAKYSKEVTSSCWWRCGEAEANQTHIFFSCPVLQQYWTEISETMENIFQCTLVLRPEQLLLGRIPQSLSQNT